MHRPNQTRARALPASREYSVPNRKFVTQIPGGASRRAALLLPHILPSMFGRRALRFHPTAHTPRGGGPGPGAALGHFGNEFRNRDTSIATSSAPGHSDTSRITASVLPRWLSFGLVAGTFLTLAIFERRRPLRRSVEPSLQRAERNLAIAALGAIAVQVAEMPIVRPVAAAVERRRWGVLKRLRLPGWLEVSAAVLLMDYTLYVWHVLTHRVPGLWRYHVVHHIDLDLDASTAVRFHFAELTLSTPWRVAQVVVIGTSPLALSIWQTGLLMSILFHHSNIELPLAVERRLNRLFVTPRMHGIHHSAVRDETNSNWSSGFTLWDWLHGTLKLNVPQREITIGVPAFRDPSDVTLPKMVALPFKPQRPHWVSPQGDEPSRPVVATSPTRLLR
jgi:sterol desaturase/sphingolipid hydroxylase (fatty acid hydroxylase superfamily)